MFDTLGDALYELGYRTTSYLHHPDAEHPQRYLAHGSFNPDAPFSDFLARYGVDLALEAGTTVGERFSDEALTTFVREGNVPGFNPPVYRALMGSQDQYDSIFTGFYDDKVFPWFLARNTPSAPPPVEPPAMPPPAPEPPPVTPPPPPAPEVRYEVVTIPADLLEDLDVLMSLPPAAKLGPHRHQRLLRIDSFLQTLPTLYRKVEGDAPERAASTAANSVAAPTTGDSGSGASFAS